MRLRKAPRPGWTGWWKDHRDVDHWSAYVGQGAVRSYPPLDLQLPNDFFSQAVVVTKGLEQRERVKARLERALEADFPNAVGRVYPLELGLPVGWPLQYRVSGRDPERSGRSPPRWPSSSARCRAREGQLQLDRSWAAW